MELFTELLFAPAEAGMRRFLLSCVVCAMGAVSIAQGAEPVVILSPEIGIATAVDRQTIELQRNLERQVMRTVTIAPPASAPTTAAQGAVKPSARTEVTTVIEQLITRVAIGQVTVRRAGGQIVPAEKLAAELRRPTAVIVLREDQRLDSACEQLFKQEVLILQFGASGAPPTIAPGQGPLRTYAPQPLAPR